MAVVKISRRQLLVGATGMTALAGGAGLWLGIRKIDSWRFRKSVKRGTAFAPSVYLAIEPDGRVVIWLTRSEMGQGVATSLPMLVAEELDADWSRVHVEHAVAGDDYDYGSLFTAASSSVTSLWTELRRAGATARQMLVSAAADGWGVPEEDCSTRNSVVSHLQSGRSLSYGELADQAARTWAPLRPTLKHPSDFQLIGKPLMRVDLPEKVTGQARFGIDVRRDGMRFASITRPPMFAGTARRRR